MINSGENTFESPELLYLNHKPQTDYLSKTYSKFTSKQRSLRVRVPKKINKLEFQIPKHDDHLNAGRGEMISFVNGEYSFRNIIDHAKKYKPASGFSKRFVQITHMSEQRYTSLYEIKLKDALE